MLIITWKKQINLFINFESQLERLKKHNLIIPNEGKALKDLQRYGYYEIINGYKDYFMIDPKDDDKGFKKGVVFDHIFELFQLDKNIRKIVL